MMQKQPRWMFQKQNISFVSGNSLRIFSGDENSCLQNVRRGLVLAMLFLK